ncbi:MAG: carbamoyl-phosphate synthase large subunit [Solirubrobacteraceae bacterium]|nr:carbamoyl-phosphate synthase large subunit [Solirubrobacteraceae bacterium]
MTRSITAMITGVGGGGHGEQVLKAVRLADTPYRIVGSDMSPYSSGLAQVDQPCLMPPASDPGYIDSLLGVCRAQGVEVLFHGSEPELRVLSAHREAILDAGIFLPLNPAEVIDTCLDKVRTMDALTAAGFAVPAYRRVRSVEEAEAFEHLPAVLKPSVGGGGSANLYLVQERDELVSCAGQLLKIYPEFIVQAYVGTPDDEYTVGVLLDMDGNLLNSIAIRRYIMSALSNRIKAPNRTGRSDLGDVLAISSGVSQGRIGRFPEVTAQCEDIALALGARGPLNIQCRLVDGRVHVFEINPRFSGTTSLRAMVGYNEPDTLVRRHVLGESIQPHFAYEEGVIMRRLAETLIAEVDFPDAAELACRPIAT